MFHVLGENFCHNYIGLHVVMFYCLFSFNSLEESPLNDFPVTVLLRGGTCAPKVVCCHHASRCKVRSPDASENDM